MRRTIGLGAFVVIGLGGAGAGALDNISMKGSDSLRDVVRDLLLECPAADPDPANAAFGIVYEGTGNGNAEDTMRAGSQTIAPMTRFFASYGNASSPGKTCNVGTLGSPAGSMGSSASSEGFIIGLESVAVVASTTAGASVTCNGGAPTGCTPNGLGLADEGAPIITGLTDTSRYPGGTYQFTSWRDVLRVVLAGIEHGDGSDITKRNCAGELRTKLAENYGLLFRQGSCAPAPGQSGTTNCTQLRHAFVPENESSATDAMISLLGVSGLNLSTNVSPWCNALRTTDPIPFDPTKSWRFSPDFQDYDVIRRDCSPNEEVCSHIANNASGTAQRYGLGLVLTIANADFIPDTQPITDDFPTAPCTNFELTALVPKGLNTLAQKRCPNGDMAAFNSQCFWPKSAAGSFKCLNSSNKRPSLTIDVDAAGNSNSIEGRPISTSDGRVYNLFVLRDPSFVGGPPTFELDGRNRGEMGAFYRIHTTKSLVTPAITCQNKRGDAQIGCLVAASNCSVGFAGRAAQNATISTAALRIHEISPALDECVAAFGYRPTRKLYVNSYLGFQAPQLATQEFGLAKCLVDRSHIDHILTNRNLLPLPATLPGTSIPLDPYCEDFNETQCGNLGNPANVNACADNPTGIPNAANSTRCGDGVKSYGEECDDGNNVNLDGCNSTCRFEQ